MMNDKRTYISKEQAMALLPEREDIHTFYNASFGLLGADWSRAEVVDKINRSDIVELTGDKAKKMGHGMCVYNEDTKRLRDILFIETDPNALECLEKQIEDEHAMVELKGKKIYIAGKITGDPDYKSKFGKAQQWLAHYGATALNPAVLPSGLAPADYMRICFAMIDSADEVFMLHDAAQSAGAELEKQYCLYIHKAVTYLDDLTNWQPEDCRDE